MLRVHSASTLGLTSENELQSQTNAVINDKLQGTVVGGQPHKVHETTTFQFLPVTLPNIRQLKKFHWQTRQLTFLGVVIDCTTTP